MRILITSTWGLGHVFPVVPLARALVAAGHTVLWATHEPACAAVSAAGLDVRQVGLDSAGVADLGRRLREQSAPLPPPDRAAFAFPSMFGAWATPVMVAGLLPLARGWQPDLVVHDQAELAAPLVAAVLGVASVTHSFGGAVPAAFVRAAAERLAGLWRDHGLAVPELGGCFAAGYVDICPDRVQTQPLDHVGTRLALRPVGYTGEPGPPLPDRHGDRPLVYLTLGTAFNTPTVLAGALAALAGLDVDVLVTVGPGMDPQAVGPQPDGVRVEQWVCQSEVLQRCDVVVHHGGSGTFLGALGCGLPQLVLPQAADQFRNAEALTAIGAGLALHPDSADTAAVAAAVERVLRDSGFRSAAQALQEDIARMPGPEAVAAQLTALV